IVKLLGRHGQSLAVPEVILIQAKGAVGFQVEQSLQDQLLVDRFAVRRQSHELVFAAIDAEADVGGEGGIEQAEAVRKAKLFPQLDAVAATHAERRRRPLTDAIKREDRRLVERRGEEGAGRVGLMMLGEEERTAIATAQPFSNDAREMKLLFHP